MRQRYDKLGAVGLNTDILPSLLEPGAWTDLYNIACGDGSVRNVYGQSRQMYLPIKPEYHTAYRRFTGEWLLIVSDGVRTMAVDIFNQAAQDITPLSGGWVGGRVSFATLNSVLVVNSATDGPFYLSVSGNIQNDTLEPLPGWDANWRCKALVAYRYYLVALYMTESGNAFPHKLRWSNAAEEGAVPTEWVASATNDAGDDLIGETLGGIVGGVVVKDYLYIVKEDAVYAMSFVGGNDVMRVDRMHGGAGTQIPEGFTEMTGGLVACTARDLTLFDGTALTSLSAQRVRKALQEIISEGYWNQTQVFRHTPSTTLWIGGSAEDDTRLNAALVFDWTAGVWWQKALHYCYGFDAIALAPSDKPLTEIALYESNQADDSWWVSMLDGSDTDADGVPLLCSAERIGLPIEGADALAMVTQAWLELDSTIPLAVTFGVQNDPDDTVSWGLPQTWTPGTTRFLTPRVTGRYLAVRVESNAVGNWRLGAITLEWQRAGER